MIMTENELKPDLEECEITNEMLARKCKIAEEMLARECKIEKEDLAGKIIDEAINQFQNDFNVVYIDGINKLKHTLMNVVLKLVD
jgi:hypothetical protein